MLEEKNVGFCWVIVNNVKCLIRLFGKKISWERDFLIEFKQKKRKSWENCKSDKNVVTIEKINLQSHRCRIFLLKSFQIVNKQQTKKR